MAEYFPASLVAKVSLPPEEGPYIFGMHPHGLLVFSSTLSFGTNGCNVDKIFPQIDIRVAVANVLFYIAHVRAEVLCWLLAAPMKHCYAVLDQKRIVLTLFWTTGLGLLRSQWRLDLS